MTRAPVRVSSPHPRAAKTLPGIRAAIAACGLRDGSTVSFHHHLRNGDDVLNVVLDEIAAVGLRNIRVAASSIFPVHAPLAGHMRSGVVTGLVTGYLAGPVAEAVAEGWLATPVIMQTHGGRARAIECGDVHIDIAFVAAPTADTYGNLNGVGGRSACGTLGYPMVDVRYADRVVAITDNLVPYPAAPIDITQDDVDFVVPLGSIGDRTQIVSGTTRVTTKPEGLRIAATAAQVIEASGLLQNGSRSRPARAASRSPSRPRSRTSWHRKASSAASPLAASPGCSSTCSGKGYSARCSTYSASTWRPLNGPRRRSASLDVRLHVHEIRITGAPS